MNRYTAITALLIAGLSFTGCKKFLKERSQDEMTPQNTSSLNELLAREGYPYVTTGGTNADGFSLCNFLFYLDDDVQIRNQDATQPLYAKPYYSWSPSLYEDIAPLSYGTNGRNPYQNFYNRIRGCNVVLDMLNQVSGSIQDKEQLEAEAKTLRAYYYFMLVNIFGRPYNDPAHPNSTSPGVPLIKSGGISETPVSRSTVKEVYDLITDDLEKAISILEKRKLTPSLYRITYRSAWLLASRVYQHQEKWDKVMAYTNKLLNDLPVLVDLNSLKPPVAIAPLLNTNPNFLDQSNPEVIFMFSALRGGDMAAIATPGTSVTVISSQSLLDTYQADDMRFAVWNSTNLPANFYNTRLGGFYSPSKLNSFGQAGRVFRLSEAYLNRAEAAIRLVMKGDGGASLQSAMDDLNALRLKRFKTGSPNAEVTLASLDNDPNKVLEFCLAERRRELCFEEFRWFDLRRNGQPELTHTFDPSKTGQPLPIETYTLAQGSDRYVFKFPPAVMAANPALEQNP